MTAQTTTRDGDLFNEALIRFYVDSPRFLRRDWLAAEVAAQLAKPDCRFVLLTAEPGAGKSTFMAQLAHDHPDWPRYFIRRDQVTPLGDVGTKSFLLRIGYQLVALYPHLFTQERVQIAVEQRIGTAAAGSEVIGAEVKRLLASPFYQKALQIQQHVERNAGRIVGLKVEELVVETRLLDLSDLQNMALLDPARALLKHDPAARIVILGDALDEIRYHPEMENVLAWLTNCPELPPNVRFVLSSRPLDDALKVFCQKQTPYLRTLAITPEDSRVRADVETYARRLASRPEVATELARLDRSADAFVVQAVTKANGNLGYLAAIERAVDAALARPGGADMTTVRALLELSELPDELEGLYAFFLRQIKSEITQSKRVVPVQGQATEEQRYHDLWPAVYEPILGVLCIAFEPLTVAQIHRLAGISATGTYVSEAVDRLAQFMDQEDGRRRLYHATFIEFLTTASTREHSTNQDLFVDAVRWHRQAVAGYRGSATTWGDVDWSHVDDYGLRHLVEHLYALRNHPTLRQELYGLISKSFMQAKLIRYASHASFANDVVLSIGVAANDRSRDGAIQLVRDELILATLHTLTANVQPELLGVFAQVGEIDKALGYASLMRDAGQKSMAYCLIGEALVTQGNREVARWVLKQALEAGWTVRYGAPLAFTMARVAKALARAGANAQAVQLAKKALGIAWDVETEREQTLGLNTVAPVLAQVGEFDTARAAAKEVHDREERVLALTELTRSLAEARQFDQALATVDVIEDRGDRALALSAVAQALAEVCDKERTTEIANQALAAVNVLDSVYWKAFTLSSVALALSKVGDKHRAGQIAEQAVETAQVTMPDRWQIRLLIGAAEALLHAGKKARAAQIAQHALAISDEIGFDTWRVEALVWWARSLMRAGDRKRATNFAKRAFKIASGMEIEAARVSALGVVAQDLARVGEIDQALVAAHRIEDDCERTDILRKIAEILVQAGDKKRAAEIANQALATAQANVSQRYKASALRRIAEALANTVTRHNLYRALSVSESIAPLLYKAAALIAVAQGFSRAGDSERAAGIADQALATAEQMKDDRYRASTLRKLAPAFARMGNFDQGISIAEAIEDELNKASALSEVAGAIAQADDKKRALEVAGRALAVTEAMSNNQRMKSVLYRLSEIFAHLGETERAAEIAGRTSGAIFFHNEIDDAFAPMDVGQASSEIVQREPPLESLRRDPFTGRMPRLIRERASLFQVLEGEAASLAALNQGETLWHVYEAVQDVDRWWGIE